MFPCRPSLAPLLYSRSRNTNPKSSGQKLLFDKNCSNKHITAQEFTFQISLSWKRSESYNSLTTSIPLWSITVHCMNCHTVHCMNSGLILSRWTWFYFFFASSSISVPARNPATLGNILLSLLYKANQSISAGAFLFWPLWAKWMLLTRSTAFTLGQCLTGSQAFLLSPIEQTVDSYFHAAKGFPGTQYFL